MRSLLLLALAGAPGVFSVFQTVNEFVKEATAYCDEREKSSNPNKCPQSWKLPPQAQCEITGLDQGKPPHYGVELILLSEIMFKEDDLKDIIQKFNGDGTYKAKLCPNATPKEILWCYPPNHSVKERKSVLEVWCTKENEEPLYRIKVVTGGIDDKKKEEKKKDGSIRGIFGRKKSEKSNTEESEKKKKKDETAEKKK